MAKIWTENELRNAVSRMIEAAYGRATGVLPKQGRAALSIPAQPDDADVILHDAICELEKYRAKQRAIESTKAVLTRLARYYQERERSATRLMNQTTDLEVAARHAHNALDWRSRYETVRKVAENLEITLQASEADQSPRHCQLTGGTLPPGGSFAVACSSGSDRELVYSSTSRHNEENAEIGPAGQQNAQHHWRVEALYDSHSHVTLEYDGCDDNFMLHRLGLLCLRVLVDKVFIWRDGEKYRHIELQ